MGRNYKDEYKKFQDSPAQKKKRAALNRENHNRGTYGNGDGLDVSHTKNGIKLEKSSINKGRKEKSRMAGSKRKKQKGGYLSGPSHKHGGIPAIVAGKQPVELEGGEYIIRKSSVDKLGKSVLEEINKKGRIPTMAKGGKVTKEDVAKNKKERSKVDPNIRNKWYFKGKGRGNEKAVQKYHDKILKASKKGKKIEPPTAEEYYHPKNPGAMKESASDFMKRIDKRKKKQMGGPIKPYASVPTQRFPKGVRMMGHGGQVSSSNDKAGAGDIHTVYTHSGYKAGE